MNLCLPKAADRTPQKSQETPPNRKPLIIGGSIAGAVMLVVAIALGRGNTQTANDTTTTADQGSTQLPGTEGVAQPANGQNTQSYTPPSSPEAADWATAQQRNTVGGYQQYLAAHPDGAHAADASRSKKARQTEADQLMQQAAEARTAANDAEDAGYPDVATKKRNEAKTLETKARAITGIVK